MHLDALKLILYSPRPDKSKISKIIAPHTKKLPIFYTDWLERKCPQGLTLWHPLEKQQWKEFPQKHTSEAQQWSLTRHGRISYGHKFWVQKPLAHDCEKQ